MTKIIYLNIDQVNLIHFHSIERHGGHHGIRDLGLLTSAISRPQSGYGDYEAYPDIYMKAAVLGYSLIKNHAFIDGNKRTGVVSMFNFLEENGYALKVIPDETLQLSLDIAEDRMDEKLIAVWLQNHFTPPLES
ncbi:MAG: type II toxin-antitoxin system death-on-curing family toxin [bacterium]